MGTLEIWKKDAFMKYEWVQSSQLTEFCEIILWNV